MTLETQLFAEKWIYHMHNAIQCMHVRKCIYISSVWGLFRLAPISANIPHQEGTYSAT